jgi:DNA mismatch endonuclease (patch repair protein)
MDKISKEVRSRNMAAIKGRDTKPEMLVRKYLFSKGFRYKLYDKSLPGTPDLVFPKYKTVLFVHGCFWHGHEKCNYFKVPKTHTKWWLEKISYNKKLDEKNKTKLKALGWRVITIFECDLKSKIRESNLRRLVVNILK